MEYSLFIFVLLIIAILGIAMAITGIGNAEGLVEQWAATNGYQLLECEQRWLRSGPFFFTKSKSQRVFRIVVSDQEGNVLRGYAKCGGWFLGMWSEQIQVRWDP